jgi:hypothetical protein
VKHNYIALRRDASLRVLVVLTFEAYTSAIASTARHIVLQRAAGGCRK